jgi:RNA polymerase sigma-70 factor (ECF subfamily)
MDSSQRDTFTAAIRGDREAFEMIIRDSARTMFSIAYAILQNPEEAEDAVQDAFIKAWKSRWRVREPEKFPAWLATIVRHRARDMARRRRPAEHALASTDDSLAEVEVRQDTTDEQVHSALSRLPETHRTAVTLRYLENLDYRTIEKTMGLSNGALRGILGRALSTMRKQLAPVLAVSK